VVISSSAGFRRRILESRPNECYGIWGSTNAVAFCCSWGSDADRRTAIGDSRQNTTLDVQGDATEALRGSGILRTEHLPFSPQGFNRDRKHAVLCFWTISAGTCSVMIKQGQMADRSCLAWQRLWMGCWRARDGTVFNGYQARRAAVKSLTPIPDSDRLIRFANNSRRAVGFDDMDRADYGARRSTFPEANVYAAVYLRAVPRANCAASLPIECF
jgi:hypothetical protein